MNRAAGNRTGRARLKAQAFRQCVVRVVQGANDRARGAKTGTYRLKPKGKNGGRRHFDPQVEVPALYRQMLRCASGL